MVIVAESKIPFLDGLLEPLGEVRRLAPEEIDAEAVRDADVLLVRTRTRVDGKLLTGSKVRFVGTATIGTDHIDREWCEAHGIHVANAPGCNAPAVVQYVLASVAAVRGINLEGLTLGVVGVGHVGGLLDRYARSVGMQTLLCDPPRAAAEGGDKFVDMARIARDSDIVTFHTPLTREGEWPTYHMADSRFFEKLERRPMIINAARGSVVDTASLKQALREGRISGAAIDCWEGEPTIDRELLAMADIATPHIAGYSREGKIRASHMVVRDLYDYLGMPVPDMATPAVDYDGRGLTSASILADYDPRIDTGRLRCAPERFEALRNGYDLRAESSARR